MEVRRVCIYILMLVLLFPALGHAEKLKWDDGESCQLRPAFDRILDVPKAQIAGQRVAGQSGNATSLDSLQVNMGGSIDTALLASILADRINTVKQLIAADLFQEVADRYGDDAALMEIALEMKDAVSDKKTLLSTQKVLNSFTRYALVQATTAIVYKEQSLTCRNNALVMLHLLGDDPTLKSLGFSKKNPSEYGATEKTKSATKIVKAVLVAYRYDSSTIDNEIKLSIEILKSRAATAVAIASKVNSDSGGKLKNLQDAFTDTQTRLLSFETSTGNAVDAIKTAVGSPNREAISKAIEKTDKALVDIKNVKTSIDNSIQLVAIALDGARNDHNLRLTIEKAFQEIQDVSSSHENLLAILSATQILMDLHPRKIEADLAAAVTEFSRKSAMLEQFKNALSSSSDGNGDFQQQSQKAIDRAQGELTVASQLLEAARAEGERLGSQELFQKRVIKELYILAKEMDEYRTAPQDKKDEKAESILAHYKTLISSAIDWYYENKCMSEIQSGKQPENVRQKKCDFVKAATDTVLDNLRYNHEKKNLELETGNIIYTFAERYDDLGIGKRFFFHFVVGQGIAMPTYSSSSSVATNTQIPIFAEQIGGGVVLGATSGNKWVFKMGGYMSGLLYRTVYDAKESKGIMYGPFFAIDVYKTLQLNIAGYQNNIPGSGTEGPITTQGWTFEICIPLGDYIAKTMAKSSD